MTTRCVLVLGATSGIAKGVAAALARRGYGLYLAGRDLQELERNAEDLRIRYGVPVYCGSFDAEACHDHGRFLDTVLQVTHRLDGVVFACGSLGNAAAYRSSEAAARLIAANFTGAASILGRCADHLERARSGFIIGISSVAGDRGRQSNYLYGAAKGALSLYLQGLRNRLFASGVRVITVKPGFVDTAMTFGMPGQFLVASPVVVGERIARTLEGRADVVYVPWFWRYVMLVIRSIPEPVFKRLRL